MQTEYKRTREEEAFYRLLDEKQSLLSEDALKLVGLAQHEAYKYNLVSNYAYQPVESPGQETLDLDDIPF